MWHAASLSFSPHAGITVSIEVRALVDGEPFNEYAVE
jgi:hypothetical protein